MNRIPCVANERIPEVSVDLSGDVPNEGRLTIRFDEYCSLAVFIKILNNFNGGSDDPCYKIKIKIVEATRGNVPPGCDPTAPLLDQILILIVNAQQAQALADICDKAIKYLAIDVAEALFEYLDCDEEGRAKDPIEEEDVVFIGMVLSRVYRQITIWMKGKPGKVVSDAAA